MDDPGPPPHYSPKRAMTENAAKTGRRYERIATPKGVWVAWQNGTQQGVSRVRDLNLGGLFIATPNTFPIGAAITLLLSVPEGEIRSNSIVRNVTLGDGVGVEFKDISAKDYARLQALIARLLPANED